jgi:hypothetical protein
MMFFTEPVWVSLLGGVSVQMLYIVDGIKAPQDRRPDFKSLSYYLGIFFNVAISGILGYVYFDENQELSRTVYFHIGLSAPLILRTLATTIPEVVRSNKSTD